MPTDGIHVNPAAIEPDEIVAEERVGGAAPLQPETLARREAEREARALQREKIAAVHEFKARFEELRNHRARSFFATLDMINDLPEMSERQKRATLAEIFGFGSNEANRLLRMASMDITLEFRELMLSVSASPELIEALLRARRDVRDLAIDELEVGNRVQKLDVNRIKRQLDQSTVRFERARKLRAIETSAVNPLRDRIKSVKADIAGLIPTLAALWAMRTDDHRAGSMMETIQERAGTIVQDFKSCFGGERMKHANADRKDNERLNSLHDHDYLKKTNELFRAKWTRDEAQLAEVYGCLEMLASGEFAPWQYTDDERDNWIGFGLLEPLAWFADVSLADLAQRRRRQLFSDAQESGKGYYASADDDKPLTSLEICAGGGGEAIGMHFAGFTPLGVFEQDSSALKTLEKNYPFGPLFGGDLREFDFSIYRGKIDLFCGGVPCQPFSSLGAQKQDNDERDLFMHAVGIIDVVRPRAVMLENVKGFGQRPAAIYRAEIFEELRKLGYDTRLYGIAAKDYGLAQKRPRTLLVAFRDGLMRDFAPPPIFPEWNATVGEALRDLMSAGGWSGVDDWVTGANQVGPTIVGASHISSSQGFASRFQIEAWDELGVDAKRVVDSAPSADDPKCKKPGLTIAMGARLQGFPDGWEFQGNKHQQRRQVANAFPPILAAAMGLAIRRALTGEEVDYEKVLSRLKVPALTPTATWFGNSYKNSRLSDLAKEMGLPRGIVRPQVMPEFLARIRAKKAG
jgi:DNA (cytosine-5)-methyltransferase 1